MFSLFIALLSSSFAFSAGFSSGSLYEAVPLEGEIYIICHSPGRTESVFKQCFREVLLPYEMDYFVTDSDVDGDKVEIISKNENGTKEKQTRKFVTSKKRSSSHFNLWIRSLTQAPLLDYGKNNLSYKIKKGKSTAEAGEFDVEVKRGKARECRPSTLQYSNESYCRGAGSEWACDDYFREENLCE